MSSGAYDASLSSSPFVPNDSWRASISIPSIYERPHLPPPRRRSPTPPRRIVSYDRYLPPRPPLPYGDDYPNTYRPAPNNYRPDELSAYYTRSPSPDRYAPPRLPEVDSWDRPSSWMPPIKTSTWQERKIAPLSPTTSISRGSRKETMLATRMFEPSDAWKQYHDRLPSGDRSRRLSSDSYTGSGIQESRSPIRRGRSPYHGGDSYRPMQTYREPYARSEYDSYRPGWLPSSPINNRNRDLYGSSSRLDFNGRHASGSGSAPGSRSPRSRQRSPNNIPRRAPRRRSSSRPGRSSSPRTRSPSRSRSRHRRSSSRHYRSISRGRRSLSARRRSKSPALRAPSSTRQPVNGTRPPITYESLPVRPREMLPYGSPQAPVSPPRSVSRPRSAITGNSGVIQSKILPADESAKKVRPRSLSRSSIASTHVPTREPSLAPDTDNLGSQPMSGKLKTLETSETKEVFNPPSLSTVTPVDAQCPPKVEDTRSGKNSIDSGTPTSAMIPVCPPSPWPMKKQSLPETIVEIGVGPPSTPLLQSVLSTNQTPTQDQTGNTEEGVLINGLPDVVHTLKPPSPPQLEHRNIASTSLNHDVFSPPPSNFNPTTCTDDVRSTKQNADLIIAEPEISPNQLTPVPTSSTTSKLVPPPPTPLPEQRPIDKDALNEQIAKSSETKSTTEALRLVVMTRLLCDRQTREELVNPVLLANQAIAAESHDGRSSSTVEEVIAEVTTGKRQEARMKSFDTVKGSLIERFKERQDFLTAKTQRLRKQYISLHERWVAHCAMLDEEAKPTVPPDAEPVSQPSGRTTRRSTANLGDAVRSDLEMEQIIASLGIDEATDPNQLSLRNLAVVPDMISVTHGKVDYVYDDTNHLIDNPGEYYGPHTGTHDWTDAEKAIFLDKFAAHPKQFGVIAQHIPNKTAAQCVDYYYLHKKKVIDFRKVISLYAPNKRRRRGMGKKKGNGLLADIRQHDAEVHRESGSPTVSGRPARGRRNMAPPESRKPAASRRSIIQQEDTPTLTPTPEPDARPRRRRAPAAAISAPISRTVSMSVDEAEEEATDIERPAKRAKRTRKVKSAAIVTEDPASPVLEPKVPEPVESNSRKRSQSTNIQWSDEDKSLFLGLLAQHGADFKRIAASMPNKTTIQVNNYYKSNLVELDLEKVAASAPRRSPSPERRETPREAPYPGSRIMSPVVGMSRDPIPPMSSLHDDMPPPQIPPSSAIHLHERSFIHSDPKHPTWATPSTSLPDVPPLSEKDHEMTNSIRALSPSQTRGYTLPAGYPGFNLNGRVPNGGYPPIASYSSVPALSYVYPSYADSLYNPYSMDQPLQRHASIQSTSDQSMITNHRISSVSSVSSIPRPENPYPVVAGPGIPTPRPMIYAFPDGDRFQIP